MSTNNIHVELKLFLHLSDFGKHHPSETNKYDLNNIIPETPKVFLGCDPQLFINKHLYFRMADNLLHIVWVSVRFALIAQRKMSYVIPAVRLVIIHVHVV